MSAVPDSNWAVPLVSWLGAILSTLVVGAWRARGVQSDLEIKIIDEVERLRRETGESLIAMRQKVTDVEIWNRDNLVKQKEFDKIIDGVHNSIESLRKSNQTGFDKINTKIDRLIDRSS